MDKPCWLKHSKVTLIYIVLLVLSTNIHASQHALNKLKLSVIADLSAVKLNNDEWLTVSPIVSTSSEYLLATKQGKIYTLKDSTIAAEPLLDLTKKIKDSNLITLTAMAVDPSFHYRDRNGYNTIYTAHIEENNSHQDKNAPNRGLDKNLPYDAVIIRWQLSKTLNQPIAVAYQHEVIRIAIHQPYEAFKQLSFNPYTEPWHEDFGLLYVLLSKAENEKVAKQAIYSGTILRIRPERFGLQSYTIPDNNPFIKQADIRNEIITIAGGNVQNFDWIKKGQNTLLMQIAGAEENFFIQARLGDDLRQSTSAELENSLPSKHSNHNTAIIYHGRALQNLWGKVLQLNKIKNNWQLQALSLEPITTAQTLPTFSSYNLANIATSKKLSLYKHSDNELLVLTHDQQLLYTIKADLENASVTTPKTAIADDDTENSSAILIIFVLIIGVAGSIWYIKLMAKKKQHFLHSQWANFDINTTNETLSLYKRHSQTAEQKLELSTIIRSELLLNDQVISIISNNTEHGFSNELEDQVLAVFAKEHRLKMINEKQRKIQLRLIDDNEVSFLICLYYRVGNIRHTKLKYNKVLTKVIDWNWLFAGYINPQHSSKRKIRVKSKIAPSVDKKYSAQVTKAVQVPSKTINNSGLSPEIENEALASTDHSATSQDTKLVMALDKLVAMKKQGFLSDDEFNIAKTKIINDLAKE